MRQALAICSLVGTLALPAKATAMYFGDSGESSCRYQENDHVKGVFNYPVQKGDTLWGIAMRIYGDAGKYAAIARANGIKNPDLIHPGQVLALSQERFEPSHPPPCDYTPHSPTVLRRIPHRFFYKRL